MAVEIKHICKSYGEKKVVDESLHLLGQMGRGKVPYWVLSAAY